MAILPQGAGLIVQRQFCDPLGELGEVEIAGINVGGPVGLADQAVAEGLARRGFRVQAQAE